MRNNKKPSEGRIVHIYPGSKDKQFPNGMDFAPAIVTQVHGSEESGFTVNAVAFLAPRSDQGWPDPYVAIFSAHDGKEIQTVENDEWFNTYWVWPPIV